MDSNLQASPSRTLSTSSLSSRIGRVSSNILRIIESYSDPDGRSHGSDTYAQFGLAMITVLELCSGSRINLDIMDPDLDPVRTLSDE